LVVVVVEIIPLQHLHRAAVEVVVMEMVHLQLGQVGHPGKDMQVVMVQMVMLVAVVVAVVV
jgi:hypothetical protein